jgi:N6-L-threonylcarbamoyladenine synthase
MNDSLILNPKSLILAIETSCDETAVAVTRGLEVLSNAIYSQIELHKQYGGVVPGIAKLAHQQKFAEVLAEALQTAGVTLDQIDAVAVTKGHGLAIALEVGIAKAKEIALQYHLPLIAMKHMAGHLYSPLAIETRNQKQEIRNKEVSDFEFQISDLHFPVLSLLVSGGHTDIVLLNDLFTPEVVGQRVDDACGEAFDKVAMMLGLEYPGGPIVSKLANEYRDKLHIEFQRVQRTLFVVGFDTDTTQEKYRLPIPMAYSGDLNVSYSGLKTAIKQIINELSGASSKLNIKQTGTNEKLNQDQIGELCLMFETAALHALILKLDAGIDQFKPSELWLGGGVAASPRLQALVRELGESHGITVRIPASKTLFTDNAGMIGVAAAIELEGRKSGKKESKIAEIYQPAELDKLDRDPSWVL